MKWSKASPPVRGWTRVLGLLAAMCMSAVPLTSWAADAASPEVAAPDRAAESNGGPYTLDSIIRYGLTHNPRVRIAGRDVETEMYGIKAARAERMPRLDLGGGVTRYRYDTPLTPIVLSSFPLTQADLPEFKRTIWDTSVTFKLPLFRGGRLIRTVNVAEMKKAVAEDMLKTTRQDLVYNLSSVFYKIAQLQKLFIANEASVKQLESHKRNVELFLETGAAPRLDLLKTDVELSHARENRLLVKNNLSSAYELLKNLMGMDDMAADISITYKQGGDEKRPALEDSLSKAFSRRPDFSAAARKVKMGEERVKIARGKRYPDIYAAGQYGGQAGPSLEFKENYFFALKFSVPVFDGGLISSEIDRERTELHKAIEEERFLRLSITRDIRDAHLAIANARERIEVTEKAIESARENLKVEVLKYDTGAGTSTDVIDARTAMLRAEADYYQAVFDKETAFAYLKKATGEEWYEEEVGK